MVTLTIGSITFVVTKEKAFELVEFLETAEVYTTKYSSGASTHHVYPSESTFPMAVLPESTYQMAKLAGKPEGY